MGDPIEPRAETIQGLEGSLRAFGADVAPGGGDAQGSCGFVEGTASGFEAETAVPSGAAARLSDVESHAAERTAQLIGKIAILYGDRLEDGPNERDDVNDVF